MSHQCKAVAMGMSKEMKDDDVTVASMDVGNELSVLQDGPRTSGRVMSDQQHLVEATTTRTDSTVEIKQKHNKQQLNMSFKWEGEIFADDRNKTSQSHQSYIMTGIVEFHFRDILTFSLFVLASSSVSSMNCVIMRYSDSSTLRME